jgi:(p)ppGpp synthase/HD superfamily hydrolase
MAEKIKIEKAISVALEAHSGQKDKAGAPYILHCLRVMLKGKTESEMITGVLHDTIEDTEVTAEYLHEKGFSDEIVEAVVCLTKTGNEKGEEYITRVLSNNIAKKVKLYDVEDNMNLLRLDSLVESDIERINKYIKLHKKLVL